MRQINLETWARREQFKAFSSWDHPHFSMCANMNLAAFRPFVKKHRISFSIAIVYVLARVANAIPEFRYRIRPGEVIEHAVVHPATTILLNGDLFTFCHFDYTEDLVTFAPSAAERIAHAKEHPTLENPPGRDDWLYMTAIPWVSFTSFMHPLHVHPVDSVPRFAWGKFFAEGEAIKMPLSVQAHHALMDGVHMGRFYEKVQDYLLQPEIMLG